MQDKYNLKDFLSDLEDAFSPMRHVDDYSRDRWSAVVVRKLGNFSGQVLQRAYDDIIVSRKAKSFPSIADLIEACQKAARVLEADKPRELAIESAKPGDDAAAYIAGDKTWKMLASTKPAVVVEAAKLGMTGSLKGFVIRKGRLPNSLDEPIQWFKGEEPHSIREAHRKFLEAYEDLVRFDVTPENLPKDNNMGAWQKLADIGQIAAWIRMGDAMIEKEKARAAWILAGNR